LDLSNNNSSININSIEEFESPSSSYSLTSIFLTKNQNTIAYQNFINSIKSPETKKKYSYLLFKYLDYLKFYRKKQANDDDYDVLAELLSKEVKTIEADLIKYIIFLKQDQNLSYSSINNRLAAIYLFFEMNDIVLNKKKINRYIGEHIKTVKDRAYTREEIKLIVDNCTLKHKIGVLLMVSTGCRIGAIPSLKIRNISYHETYKLYQILFYENTKDEYYSFTTPECANYIQKYLEYRERCGEKLKPESPLIRDDFMIDDLLHIENPKHITIDLFIFYLWNILKKTGIRKISTATTAVAAASSSHKKNDGSRLIRQQDRQNVSQNHGFRKFTHTTMANARINPEIREMLLGHSIGLGDSYYRPSETELLEEYLKVVDDLTINDENRLTIQVKALNEKNQEAEYVIKGKLQEMLEQNKEKDQQIKALQDSINFLSDTVNRALLADPSNKIISHDKDKVGTVKGIELKPEINNKSIGKVIPSKKK
jgi:integrase